MRAIYIIIQKKILLENVKHIRQSRNTVYKQRYKFSLHHHFSANYKLNTLKQEILKHDQTYITTQRLT